MPSRIAMIVADNFEQVEMTEVRTLLEEAGFTVDLIAPKTGTVQGLHHIDTADTFAVDRTLDEAHPDEYDAVVLPGGAVNADQLRAIDKACDFIRDMYDTGKPIAAICHAPWVLVSSGIVRGHTFTSYPTLQDDIRNAGGTWVNKEVVVDGTIITSRTPDDIPAFSQAIIDMLNK